MLLIKDAFSFQNIQGIKTLVGRRLKLFLYHLQINAGGQQEEKEHGEKAVKGKMLKLNYNKAQRYTCICVKILAEYVLSAGPEAS